MVFNSYTFALFFMIVLAVSYANVSWTVKKGFLLLASYLFYAAWNPPLVALIWLSTIVDWQVARAIHATSSKPRKKTLVVISLMTNLGVLGFFKYGDFALESFVALVATLDLTFQPAPLDIILPVGISFYTFQTLSYTLDVYRGTLTPSKSFLDFALFVTFFPQLVAGPIVRARDFLPQLSSKPLFSRPTFVWGCVLIILGMFQKVAIADGLLAPIVEKVFDNSLIPSSLSGTVGTLAFAGQIFCDFAGYSTIAIGTAMCLGFRLPDNFLFPYAAIGFSDFWRRWHVSLSSWLRDYLYISLGGNRAGAFNTYRNLVITMLLGGLWHGASWNFVFWGGLHGLYLAAERKLQSKFGHFEVWTTLPGKLFLAGLTFALVCFAWIFFRADTFTRSRQIIEGILLLEKPQLWVDQSDVAITISAVGMLLASHWLLRNTTLEEAVAKVPAPLRVVCLSMMILLIFISPGEDRAFIYFQF